MPGRGTSDRVVEGYPLVQAELAPCALRARNVSLGQTCGVRGAVEHDIASSPRDLRDMSGHLDQRHPLFGTDVIRRARTGLEEYGPEPHGQVRRVEIRPVRRPVPGKSDGAAT